MDTHATKCDKAFPQRDFVPCPLPPRGRSVILSSTRNFKIAETRLHACPTPGTQFDSTELADTKPGLTACRRPCSSTVRPETLRFWAPGFSACFWVAPRF